MSRHPTSRERAAIAARGRPAPRSRARPARRPRAIGQRPILPVLTVLAGAWAPPAPRGARARTRSRSRCSTGCCSAPTATVLLGPGDRSTRGATALDGVLAACGSRCSARAFTEALSAVAGAGPRAPRPAPVALTLTGRGGRATSARSGCCGGSPGAGADRAGGLALPRALDPPCAAPARSAPRATPPPSLAAPRASDGRRRSRGGAMARVPSADRRAPRAAMSCGRGSPSSSRSRGWPRPTATAVFDHIEAERRRHAAARPLGGTDTRSSSTSPETSSARRPGPGGQMTTSRRRAPGGR